MKKLNKKMFIIAIILVILFLALYLLFKLNERKKEQNKNIVNNSIVTYDASLGDPTRNVEETDIETSQLKDSYLEKIEKDSSNNLIKLSDYKINEITFLTEEQKNTILEVYGDSFYKPTDTFAYLTYSVKPEDANYRDLIGAGAEQNGEWIIYTNVCVCFRDGNIISAGTSW